MFVCSVHPDVGLIILFSNRTGCEFSVTPKLLAWAKVYGNSFIRERCVRKMVGLRGSVWGGNVRDRSVFWPVRSLCTDLACISFLPLLQEVRTIYKTCNQFIVKDRIRLWKEGVRDLVMELCCALHNFRVR